MGSEQHERTVLLQTDATARKLSALNSFSEEAAACANWMLSKKAGRGLMALWVKVGAEAKVDFGFNSQVVCDLARSVAGSRGARVSGTTVKFNIPRNCRTFRPKGRKFNRKVMTIPFSLFKRTLESRCFDSGIALNSVDAYHTSKWCSRCGAVGGRGHDGGNYSLFRCRECGQVVNSDRKASLAVAVKSLLERTSPNAHSDTIQISGRRVLVSGLMRNVSDAPEPLAVPALALGRGKPSILIGGSLPERRHDVLREEPH